MRSSDPLSDSIMSVHLLNGFGQRKRGMGGVLLARLEAGAPGGGASRFAGAVSGRGSRRGGGFPSGRRLERFRSPTGRSGGLKRGEVGSKGISNESGEGRVRRFWSLHGLESAEGSSDRSRRTATRDHPPRRRGSPRTARTGIWAWPGGLTGAPMAGSSGLM